MKVTPNVVAVTRVGADYVPLIPRQEIDLPDDLATRLADAGIITLAQQPEQDGDSGEANTSAQAEPVGDTNPDNNNGGADKTDPEPAPAKHAPTRRKRIAAAPENK